MVRLSVQEDLDDCGGTRNGDNENEHYDDDHDCLCDAGESGDDENFTILWLSRPCSRSLRNMRYPS